MSLKQGVGGKKIRCLPGVIVILLWASSAAAEGREAGDLWLGAEVGVGYTSGTYRFEGPVNSGYGQTGNLSFTPRLAGPELALSVFAGAAIADRWALGVISHPSAWFGSKHGALGQSDVDGGAQIGLELAAQFWLQPSWQLRLSAGVATASLLGSGQDIGSADNIVEFESMTGPVGHLQVGWKPGGIGAFIRSGFAYLEGDHSRYTPFDLVLGVSFSTL